MGGGGQPVDDKNGASWADIGSAEDVGVEGLSGGDAEAGCGFLPRRSDGDGKALVEKK